MHVKIARKGRVHAHSNGNEVYEQIEKFMIPVLYSD
jgi:hypothetical protein